MIKTPKKAKTRRAPPAKNAANLPAVVTPLLATTYRPLPQTPASERDLALIAPEGVTAAQVSETIVEAGGPHLEDVGLFDVYEGEGVPAGARSLAFRLRFRSSERTLKDKEVDKSVQAISRRLEEGLGVELRG